MLPLPLSPSLSRENLSPVLTVNIRRGHSQRNIKLTSSRNLSWAFLEPSRCELSTKFKQFSRYWKKAPARSFVNSAASMSDAGSSDALCLPLPKKFRYNEGEVRDSDIVASTGCLKKNVVSWKKSHNYPQTHLKCKCWGCIGKSGYLLQHGH